MACMMSNAAKQNIDTFQINCIYDKIAQNLYKNKAAEKDAPYEHHLTKKNQQIVTRLFMW